MALALSSAIVPPTSKVFHLPSLEPTDYFPVLAGPTVVGSAQGAFLPTWLLSGGRETWEMWSNLTLETLLGLLVALDLTTVVQRNLFSSQVPFPPDGPASVVPDPSTVPFLP